MKPGRFGKATPEFMGFKSELQRTSIANHLSMQKKNPVLAPLTSVSGSDLNKAKGSTLRF